MKMPAPPNLRTNPFLTYRDPQTGHWVTVLPKTEERLDALPKRPPQVIRVVEPEDFDQMKLELA